MSDLFWSYCGIIFVLLLFCAAYIVALSVRHRHAAMMIMGLLIMGVNYFSAECTMTYYVLSNGHKRSPASTRWAHSFVSLPKPAILLLCLICAVILLYMKYTMDRIERNVITPMSVKEATDSLPAGLCFYLPEGRVLLANTAMKRICRSVTGGELFSGKKLWETLCEGELPADCRRESPGPGPIITLSDGTTWQFKESSMLFQKSFIYFLHADDITEEYQKTASLKQMQEELSALNRRLTEYNKEIVDLTAEKELLDSRIRLHDEMGADLLTIKNYIRNGGTEQERREIETRLQRNIGFLKTGQTAAARDEYELILETAGDLGVAVILQGELPQSEPQKHVIASAIHECLTNTLRHAQGDVMTVTIETEDGRIIVRITNNGQQPTEPVREKGGLASLRTMTEQIPGGKMEIFTDPCFTVQLTLPEEVLYAV